MIFGGVQRHINVASLVNAPIETAVKEPSFKPTIVTEFGAGSILHFWVDSAEVGPNLLGLINLLGLNQVIKIGECFLNRKLELLFVQMMPKFVCGG